MYCILCGSTCESFPTICDKCTVEKDVDDLIKCYFHRGYPYDAIVGLLEKHDGLHMCVRTLKRRLQSLGLHRKGNTSRVEEEVVRTAIGEEMRGPGMLAGYRSIWHALRLRHGIHVPRSLVANIMKEVDPVGVHNRRSRRLKRRTFTSNGANASWHMDGYDKLKPFGFPIHGAVDGFSRKILWLQVVKSNNDPRVPAELYLDHVKEVDGCPLLLISDCGTENGIAAAMQCNFRASGQDEQAGEKSHKYCSSPANQRIEGWWSFLRRNRSSWWINLFKDMEEHSLLQLGHVLHMECLWFCFSKVLQNDLNKVKDHWNSHKITKSGHSSVSGVPDVMYYLPEYYEKEDCLVSVSEQQEQEMEEHCLLDIEENTYQEYFEYVLEIAGWAYPCNEEDALQLFQKIIALQN